jgi:light-regulated signal transduction histidine kinase (bacteriophytochrome)
MPHRNDQLLAENCLKYFGKMTASATHELKNYFAIINENAGLLDDLVELSERNGTPLSNDRIKQTAKTLVSQVRRADHTLKNLNRFSHIVDRDIQQIDLCETVKFTVLTASRLLEMMGVSVLVNASKEPVIIDTQVFFLKTLLWRGIETACRYAGDSKKIAIEITQAPCPVVWFVLSDPAAGTHSFLSSTADILLIEHLGIMRTQDPDKYRFGLIWPDSN